MNFSINYLRELLDTDYDFKIYTENNVKVIETKYGKYYSHVLDEATLFRSLVHMRACMFNKENENGR